MQNLADDGGGIGVATGTGAVYLANNLVVANAADTGGGGSIWVALAGAMVCGLLIYSLHVGVFARIFWRPLALRWHLGKDKHPWISKDQRKLAEGGLDRLLLDLSVSRLRRRISEAPEIRSVQKGLDRWHGMVGFLYCAAYVMIIVPLLTLCPQFEVGASKLLPHLVTFGFVTLFAALISDYIETWHELWATATYKDAKKAKKTTSRKRSR